MKAPKPIHLLPIALIFLLGSCMTSNFENFNKRKYLDLKSEKNKILPGLFSNESSSLETSTLQISIQNNDENLVNELVPQEEIVSETSVDSATVCDTLVFKNGETKAVEIQDQSFFKVYYTGCGRSFEAWNSMPKTKIKRVAEYDEYGAPSTNYKTEKKNFLMRKIALVILLASITLMVLLLVFLFSPYWILIQGLFAAFSIAIIGYLFTALMLKLNPKREQRIIKLMIAILISLALTAFCSIVLAAGLVYALFLLVPAAIIFIGALGILTVEIFR